MSDWHNGDPVGSEASRGKARSERKGRNDGGWTGTEQRTKDRLMNQFRRTGEGPGAPSEAYRNASCWCACGRLKAENGYGCCGRCLDARVKRATAEFRDPALHDELKRVVDEQIAAACKGVARSIDQQFAKPNGWEIDDEIRAAIALECPIRKVPWSAGEVLGRVMARLRGRANPGRVAQLVGVWMDVRPAPLGCQHARALGVWCPHCNAIAGVPHAD